jgi:uncharacterized protein (DUF2252 family)
MMTGQHCAAQVIEACETALVAVALAMPLHLIMTVADHRAARAARTARSTGPPMLPNELVAFCVVDQRGEINQV